MVTLVHGATLVETPDHLVPLLETIPPAPFLSLTARAGTVLWTALMLQMFLRITPRLLVNRTTHFPGVRAGLALIPEDLVIPVD